MTRGRTVPIATYFSHSYRVEDQERNKAFWSHFKSDFSFFVDPPSEITIHAHIERMMRRCSAFVAVFNRRKDIRTHCSPFMLYEYGLAVQARRPKLLLIDRTLDSTPFGQLEPEERFDFSANDPDDGVEELKRKIKRLKKIAKAYPNALRRPRGKIAVIVPRDKACAYADETILEEIKDIAHKHGFTIGVVEVPHEHNAKLALELDQFEAVILDVRGMDLPDWIFPYVHGRLVPTIKLVRLKPHEYPGSFTLPPIVQGLRMDPDEPCVESVLYWRNEQDVLSQLERAFDKMDEEETVFKDDAEALYYFDSIGRRPANIFISNAGNENPLARKLSQALRLRNIQRFHYKDTDAIPTGSNWPHKILDAVGTCDVFVAIIGGGYQNSEWSRKELEIAGKRRAEIVLLPYVVQGTDLRFLSEYKLKKVQVSPLPADLDAALTLILDTIQKKLTEGGRGHNSRVSRTTMLGGSREAIIDTIRHVPNAAWKNFLAKLSKGGIPASAAGKDSGPLRSRSVAERLFADAVEADTDPGNKSSMRTLVQALKGVAPASHLKLIELVESRITGN